MNTENIGRAKRLLLSIGEMSDAFLEETEAADIAARRATRKRAIQYGAVSVGAVASVGITVACLLLRPKRSRIGNVSAETA